MEKLVPNDNDINSFIIAIKSGFTQQIKEYLAKYGNDIVNRIEPQNRQPSLYFAAILVDQNMSYEIMKMLIQHGANAQFKDHLEQTVMFYVCKDGKQKCIDLLLAQGVKIDQEDNYGQTPLYYAASENKINILDKFAVKDLNHRDKLAGQTPLFYAARKGHLQMCQRLIEKGCDPLIQDNNHKLPTQYARKAKFIQVADYLAGQIKKIKDMNKVSTSQINQSSHNDSKKRKKDNIVQTAKQSYKIVLMNNNGQLHDLTYQQVHQLLKDKPQLQKYLANPQSIPTQQLEATIQTWQKIATKILTTCWKIKGSFWFQQAVDPVKFNIMDYFDVITKPIDLGTIKKKLSHNVYDNASEFVSDMRLIFTNCYRYNGQTHDISKCAKEIQTVFQENLKTQGLDKHLKD